MLLELFSFYIKYVKNIAKDAQSISFSALFSLNLASVFRINLPYVFMAKSLKI